MALTIGNMARLGAQSALAAGQDQANRLGLGQKSAQGLAINNLMGGKGDDKGLLNTASPVKKGDVGASLVNKTLNLLNRARHGKGGITNSITPSFQEQKAILSAGVGSIISTKI